MSTKSFTSEIIIDKKAINSLIKALHNENKPNRKPIKNVEKISNADEIRNIFLNK